MKKSTIIRILDKRCRHLEQYKEKLQSGFDVEANHHFRVEIKKLRALLRLLHHTQVCAGELNLPKSFHQFYKAVGEVRSLQLQRKSVEALCKELDCSVPVGYMDVLVRNEKKARKQVSEKAKEVSVSRLHQQLVKAIGTTLHKKDTENFVQQKKSKLVEYLAVVSLTEEVLHDIRKLLKDLLYVWPLIEEVMAEAFPPLFFSKAVCLRLAERLGRYQDCCVAISLLGPAFITDLNTEDQQRVAAIKEKFYIKRDKEKEALIVSLLLLKNALQATVQVELKHRLLHPIR